MRVEEARNYLQEQAGGRQAVSCPCCKQLVKIYHRPFNAQMARGLIWLVREFMKTRTWIHVPSEAPGWLVQSRELPKVRYWDLAKSRENDDPEKRTSGYWKPTRRGASLVLRGDKIPKIVKIYNNKVLGFTGDLIDIQQALKEKFNYETLMETTKGTEL